jgi:hypothetical protein
MQINLKTAVTLFPAPHPRVKLFALIPLILIVVAPAEVSVEDDGITVMTSKYATHVLRLSANLHVLNNVMSRVLAGEEPGVPLEIPAPTKLQRSCTWPFNSRSQLYYK